MRNEVGIDVYIAKYKKQQEIQTFDIESVGFQELRTSQVGKYPDRK